MEMPKWWARALRGLGLEPLERAERRCRECDAPFGVTLRRHHCQQCGRVFCHLCCTRRAPETAERVCTFCYSQMVELGSLDPHFPARPEEATREEPGMPVPRPSRQASSPKGKNQYEDTDEEPISPHFANTPIYALIDQRRIHHGGHDPFAATTSTGTNDDATGYATTDDHYHGRRGRHCEHALEEQHDGESERAGQIPTLNIGGSGDPKYAPIDTPPKRRGSGESDSNNDSEEYRAMGAREKRRAPSGSLAVPIPDEMLDEGTEMWRPPELTVEHEGGAQAREAVGAQAKARAVEHLRELAEMLLRAEDVRSWSHWGRVVAGLARDASAWVDHDVPLTERVKIKRVPSGSPDASSLVDGVVCRKNVAHRRMPTRRERCRVAAIKGAIEFQRSDARHLSSMDTLLQRESDHLASGVDHILSVEPDVVLVEKSVARRAQELLLHAGASLVINVGEALLAKVSRSTGATPATPFDIEPAYLGVCGEFRVDYVADEHVTELLSAKWPLMRFQGCDPSLGVTVILQGDSMDTLAKVKRVLRRCLPLARHLGLEAAFLADEFSCEARLGSPDALAALVDASALETERSNNEMVGERKATCSPHVALEGMAVSGPEWGLTAASFLLHEQERMMVSIAGRNIRTGSLCEPHAVRRVDHYGQTDMPLGEFIEAALPGPGRCCVNPNCGHSPEAHVRTYLQGKGRVALRVRRAPKRWRSECEEGELWTWSRCMKCAEQAAKGDNDAAEWERLRVRARMSDEAARMSFGRFLELMLNSPYMRAPCGHALHRDHVRFFARRGGIACVQLQPVVPLTVHTPDPFLSLDVECQQEHMDKERSSALEEARQLFNSVERNLRSLWRWELFSAGFTEERQEDKPAAFESRRRYNEQLDALDRERAVFFEHARGAQESQPHRLSIGDVNRLRHSVMHASRRWTRRMQDLASKRRLAVPSRASETPGPSNESWGEDTAPLARPSVTPADSQQQQQQQGATNGGNNGSATKAGTTTTREKSRGVVSLWRQGSGGSDKSSQGGDSRPSSPAPSGGGRAGRNGNEERGQGAPKVSVWAPTGRAHLAENSGESEEDAVVVYDDEPTTVVAMALAHEGFRQKVEAAREREQRDAVERDQQQQEWSGSEQSHVKYTFELESASNHGGATAKYSVTAYYAPQFQSIRAALIGGDEPFIDSLCRSRKWDTSGGKSNAYFAKTLDDRFVVKQLSKTELSSFLEFGPSYFQYMASALKRKSPTALAKLLGVFNVVLRTPKANGAYHEDKLNFVVQENLFYGRHVSAVYDLKGSLRSRYNEVCQGVLLDENLVETLSHAPLLVEERSKALLEIALHNDSQFLSSLGVMDYSLLVGIDEGRCELVVGLIDFVRKYTWDKQLETYVKQSGVLGGGGKEPTVISPKQYMKRFCKAMSQYFVLVPEVATRDPARLLDQDDPAPYEDTSSAHSRSRAASSLSHNYPYSSGEQRG